MERTTFALMACSLVACAQGFSEPTGGSGGGSAGHPSTGGAGGGEGGNPSTGGGIVGGQTNEGGAEDGGGGGSVTCDESPCKLVTPQCGCDEGKKCTVNGAGNLQCVADGPATLGAACGTGNDCAAGGLCLGGGTSGYCAEFCDLDTDCPTNAICTIELDDGNGGALPGIALCSSACDPGTGTGCPTGLGCVLGREADGALRFFFTCFASGAGLDGAACTSAAQCAVGYGCYNNGTSAVCLKNCNVNGGSCGGGQTCFALQDENANPIVVNNYAMGVCQ